MLPPASDTLSSVLQTLAASSQKLSAWLKAAASTAVRRARGRGDKNGAESAGGSEHGKGERKDTAEAHGPGMGKEETTKRKRKDSGEEQRGRGRDCGEGQPRGRPPQTRQRCPSDSMSLVWGLCPLPEGQSSLPPAWHRIQGAKQIYDRRPNATGQ